MTAPTDPNVPADMSESKRNALLNMLDGGHDVFVLLDPRRSGALVPLQFQRQPVLALQLGYNLAKPIPDLEVADDGVGCTLSFNGRTEYCFVPWHAVFSVRSAIGGILWPEDVPVEARGAIAAAVAPNTAAPAPGGAVISLDSRRTPKDRITCERRRRAAAAARRSELTAPVTPDGAA
jgi:stringent starvation protein B